ncbi:MAG TPA: hypothetical protein PKO06_00300 [Candidatus Ozemobacteraceae bacterium]|nr:hypothetical protein [Candidatus Ozemobacteraceae bacterium]
MNTLWNKFLNLSPWVRMLLAVALVLLLSMSIAGVGLYNFVQALKIENEPVRNPPTDVMTSAGQLKPSSTILRFVSAAQTINTLGDRTSIGKTQAQPASLTPELISAFQNAIATMAATNLADILEQGYRSTGQQDAYNLLLLRERVRCLASFSIMLKREAPTTDVSPILKAMVHDTLLMERVSPLLISKMVSVACGGIVSNMIHQLVATGSLLPSEAGSLRQLIGTFKQYRLSLAEAMIFEARFVETLVLKLYRRAPLGSWLLHTIFGDPMIDYRKVVAECETMDRIAFHAALEKISNPLTKIMIPNLTKAREVFIQKAAWESIVIQELQDLEGATADKAIDPYTSQALLMKQIDGKNRYYAAGPNARDDGMTDDDVFFAP